MTEPSEATPPGRDIDVEAEMIEYLDASGDDTGDKAADSGE